MKSANLADRMMAELEDLEDSDLDSLDFSSDIADSAHNSDVEMHCQH